MKDINMKFSLKLELWTEPKWVTDHGAGTLAISNASISLNLIPQNDNGSLHIEFYETAFHIGDYEVELSSESDLSKATQILLNNFKNFFK
jgi:hypothetical protein